MGKDENMSVDLSGSIMRRIRRAVGQAEKLEQANEWRCAAGRYREAAELHEKMAADYSVSRAGIRNQLAIAAAYRRRSEELRSRPEHGVVGIDPKASGLGSPAGTAHQTWGGDVEEGVPGTEGLRNHIRSLIQTSPVRWEDVGGLIETKRQLQMALSLMVARLPQGIKLPRSRMVLLEGPPGTGKTLLASAVAGHLGAKFFNVKVSQLTSRYFGDSPRLVSLLFEEARAQAPSVVFLDEFESLAPARTGDESGAERRVLSTMLAELDGVVSKSDDPPVLTIAATNTPDLLDEAILSRVSNRIMVPLPDGEARIEILRIQIERAGFLSTVPMQDLVRMTEGLSGRDISQLCTLAKENMLLRANPHLVGLDGNVGRMRQEAEKLGSSGVGMELIVQALRAEDFGKARGILSVK